MGYQRHHAILVTTCKYPYAYSAHQAAEAIFETVSPIMESAINEHYTFLIPPDGSYEDRDESNVGDDRRDKYIEWLKQQTFEDGSSPYDWVEIQYGDDEDENIVTRAESDDHPNEEL